jgi:hypothetical protein
MRRHSTRCVALLASSVIALPIAATNAHAVMKENKFHFVQNELSTTPYLEMRHDGEKWIWNNKADNFNMKVKVKIRTVGNKFDEGKIYLPAARMFLWQMPAGLQSRNFETLDTITVGKSVLTAFQGDAANLCSVFGGEKKSIRDLEVNAVLSAYHSGDVYERKGSFPVQVVCMPMEPHRTPVELKVTQLKLYTVPAEPKCGQPVSLITEIHTNKPGKVEFQLFRRDGEKQEASLVTEKISGGYAKRWSKRYTYNQSIRREYLVVVRGHEFSSQWVPVDVRCGAQADNADRPADLAN